MATSVFLGRGDVVGPSSATDGALCAFDGTTGKLIKVAAAGVYVASIAGTANQITASAATGAVTLSIPSTFIAPGSIAATTTISGTTITGTAGIVSTQGGTAGMQIMPATMTQAAIYRTTSTGNNTYLGSEASAGGTTLAGSTAYATLVGNASNVPIEFFTNNSKVLTLAVGGLATFAGAVKVAALGAFAAGDKYVIADATGNLHVSALGPAS